MVMITTRDFIEGLKTCLGNGLPGREAQFQMAAIGRPHISAVVRDDVRMAAVLISLIERNDKLYTTVIKRVVVDGDRHSGQISFPGGRRENGEPLQQTAIRESHEEVGTPMDKVQLLGKLTELHIPVSNFIVHPYVGFIEHPYEYVRQESEVDAIHDIPVEAILDRSNRKRKEVRVPEGFLLKDVPYFDLAGEVVWGATAMIMSEFAAVVESVSVPGSH